MHSRFLQKAKQGWVIRTWLFTIGLLRLLPILISIQFNDKKLCLHARDRSRRSITHRKHSFLKLANVFSGNEGLFFCGVKKKKKLWMWISISKFYQAKCSSLSRIGHFKINTSINTTRNEQQNQMLDVSKQLPLMGRANYIGFGSFHASYTQLCARGLQQMDGKKEILSPSSFKFNLKKLEFF